MKSASLTSRHTLGIALYCYRRRYAGSSGRAPRRVGRAANQCHCLGKGKHDYGEDMIGDIRPHSSRGRCRARAMIPAHGTAAHLGGDAHRRWAEACPRFALVAAARLVVGQLSHPARPIVYRPPVGLPRAAHGHCLERVRQGLVRGGRVLGLFTGLRVFAVGLHASGVR